MAREPTRKRFSCFYISCWHGMASEERTPLCRKPLLTAWRPTVSMQGDTNRVVCRVEASCDQQVSAELFVISQNLELDNSAWAGPGSNGLSRSRPPRHPGALGCSKVGCRKWPRACLTLWKDAYEQPSITLGGVSGSESPGSFRVKVSTYLLWLTGDTKIQQ